VFIGHHAIIQGVHRTSDYYAGCSSVIRLLYRAFIGHQATIQVFIRQVSGVTSHCHSSAQWAVCLVG